MLPTAVARELPDLSSGDADVGEEKRRQTLLMWGQGAASRGKT
jgi:hypothetical protein